jgi:hypothetical protein
MPHVRGAYPRERRLLLCIRLNVLFELRAGHAGLGELVRPDLSSARSAADTTTVVPEKCSAGNMVAERFAGAGRHDRERVLALQHARDHAFLTFTAASYMPNVRRNVRESARASGTDRSRRPE